MNFGKVKKEELVLYSREGRNPFFEKEKTDLD